MYMQKQEIMFFFPDKSSHTFRLLTDTAVCLLMITPGGFEALFIQYSRPALSLELLPLGDILPKSFFERVGKISEQLGATPLPAL